jgi:hypothetical protein
MLAKSLTRRRPGCSTPKSRTSKAVPQSKSMEINAKLTLRLGMGLQEAVRRELSISWTDFLSGPATPDARAQRLENNHQVEDYSRMLYVV